MAFTHLSTPLFFYLFITLASPSSACTLGTAPGCSTAVAGGLTTQLIAELARMGVSFSNLDDPSKIRCTSPCVPLLQSSAKTALTSVASKKNDYITLNSAYRSSAQQYLLYRQFLSTTCGVSAAARPGTSNHESGIGIDVRSYSYWRSTLQGFLWKWLGSFDPVHYDYQGKHQTGVSKLSLMAFQRLWNRNNPSDQILEDGKYGSNTAARLAKTPCDGW